MIKLPFPIPVNAMYANRKGGRRKSDRYKAWIDEAQWMLNTQYLRVIKGTYSIHIKVKRPDNRRRDIDNLIKCVSDILVTNGVIEDDSLCERLLIEWGGEECEVNLEEVEAIIL